MSDTPAKHDHERGAPLTPDCDNWCFGNHKRYRAMSDTPHILRANCYTCGSLVRVECQDHKDLERQLAEAKKELVTPFTDGRYTIARELPRETVVIEAHYHEALKKELADLTSGWNGYAWKNDEYIDDIQEYFDARKAMSGE